MLETQTADGHSELTPQEIAERLKITRGHAYQMIREGRIPGLVRVGRLVRVRRAEFEAWIEAGGESPETPRN